jgi:hypothetical protein
MSTSLVSQSYLDHFAETPSIYTSCTNEDHHPRITRVLSGWGDIESNTLSFAVSDIYSTEFIAQIKVGTRISLVAATLNNYLTYQYKGTVVSVGSSSAEDLKKINSSIDKFCSLVAYVGIDSDRYRVGFEQAPYSTITFEVDTIFDQTPRLGAGALLSSKE